ncbi:hypothetical protein AK830_g12080 [Neonectria ditissima]|uniref:Zn(2)-C6 fungal-type domain-containing protein n=1 Tax=Neonectria ditissima TaxID=78410 RepID=A0A0P7B1D1_9HYPO|nr:hypothetical protein AK830_g12080 [Neonectria ditissima]
MEIQFSILLNTRRTGSAANPPEAASGRSAGAAAARGGTHRFALETRTRHTRRSSTRARTGCSTCKKRHVKCDETKPSCLNCMKWRGYCDGYTESSSADGPSRSETPATATSKNKPNSSAKLIHTKKAPLLIEEPTVNTICFTNSEQRAYFDEWSTLSVQFLSGGLGQSRLWTTTMPQLTLQEPILRYAAMAVGALRKAACEPDSGTGDPMDNKHSLNAIVYYCEALRMQSKAKPSKEGLRTAMLSSLMFICFEAQRGNIPAALKHVTHGFSMLNELAACTEKAPDLVSIAPAPPALVQEILDCYRPLELQSRSYMGSYKKFFFPPKQQPPPASGNASANPTSSPAGPAASSPLSQPGSPWRGAPPSQNPANLPSPQSQGSPRSQAEQQTPPRGPPQRPPGIAPFTKHSPYFRPKLTNITKLEEMPPMFSSLGEAAGYWALLQRQMVHHIPLLTQTTARLALTKVVDLKELEMKLSSVKQQPGIAKFVDESRYWLHRWSQAFDPFLQAATNNRHNNSDLWLQAINLRIEYLILFVYTALPRFEELENARALTPCYHEINVIAETLISRRASCGFAMDSGWTWPVFVSSFGCRDPAIRDDAIRILDQYPIRNALRDSRIFKAISLKNREVELMNSMEGTEAEQWLRLRRRELVFEDLGTNIIFRSAQKNQATDEWELVEEVAAFMVGPDDRLDWHRQPISASASILSGLVVTKDLVLSPAAKKALVEQVADYQAQIIEATQNITPFRGIRTLHHAPQENSTDATGLAPSRIVSRQFFSGQHFDYDIPRGPFRSSHAWLDSCIKIIIQEQKVVAEQEEGEEQKDDAEYWQKVASRLGALLPEIFPTIQNPPERTVLWHDDLSLSNILVDDKGAITAVIDWECVSTMPYWVATEMPGFLIGTRREHEPVREEYGDESPEEAEAARMQDGDGYLDNEGKDELYWIHLMEYEQTQLRKAYTDRMRQARPSWDTEVADGALKVDFLGAVDRCAFGFDLKGLERWIDAIERGEFPTLQDVLEPPLA